MELLIKILTPISPKETSHEDTIFLCELYLSLQTTFPVPKDGFEPEGWKSKQEAQSVQKRSLTADVS